jgi:hypothetical protein
MARLIQVRALALALVRNLPVLPDRPEEADGAAEPAPTADGGELMLAENEAYLVDDQRRWRALAGLRRTAGLAPEQILAAPEAVLREVVAPSSAFVLWPYPDTALRRVKDQLRVNADPRFAGPELADERQRPDWRQRPCPPP